jgi:hypothetical protein
MSWAPNPDIFEASEERRSRLGCVGREQIIKYDIGHRGRFDYPGETAGEEDMQRTRRRVRQHDRTALTMNCQAISASRGGQQEQHSA